MNRKRWRYGALVVLATMVAGLALAGPAFAANIAVEHRASIDRIYAVGDTITYEIKVANSNPNPMVVRVTDVRPDGVVEVLSQGPGSEVSIPANESMSFSLAYVIKAGDVSTVPTVAPFITNRVVVDGRELKPVGFGQPVSASTDVVTSIAEAGVPKIQLTPSELYFFGAIKIGESQPATFGVTNVGSAALTVSSLSLSGDSDFTLPSLPSMPTVLAPGDSLVFNGLYTPSRENTATGLLEVVSNDPLMPTASIPVVGYGLPAGTPKIELLPPSIFFGDVQVGRSLTASMTVRNGGDAPLVVSDMTLAPDSEGFSLVKPTLPRTLAPNDTLTFDVTFAPSRENTASAVVAIASNDPATPVVSGWLGGFGTGSASHPAIDLRKSVAPTMVTLTEADPRASVGYTYEITNTGDTPLSNVTLTDDKLGVILGVGGSNGPAKTLVPGETAIVEVPSVLVGSPTHNVATAEGVDATGKKVSAMDDADVAASVVKTFRLRYDLAGPTDGFFVRYAVGGSTADLPLVDAGAGYSIGRVTLPYGTTISSWQFFVVQNGDPIALSPVAGPETVAAPMTNEFAYEPGTISGHKFIGSVDQNTPAQGWTVYLYRNGAPMPYMTSMTGSDGGYRFTDLPPGSYAVSEAEDPYYVRIKPAGENRYGPFEVVSGSVFADNDFVNQRLSAALEIQKVADKTSAKVGDTIQYTLRVTNIGDQDLVNVHVTDPKLGLDYTFPTLVRGASETVPQILTTYVVKSTDGSLVYNVASATATSVFGPVGPVQDDNGVAVTTPVVPPAFVKAADKTTALPGEIITYSVTYTNTGDQPIAAPFTVVDNYDERYATPADLNGGVDNGDTITWTDSTALAVGESRTITYTMRVNSSMPGGTTLVRNTAVLHWTGGQVESAWAVTAENPSGTGALDIEKVADKSSAKVGDTIQYTLRVTNIGNLDLTNVHVTDAKLGLDYTFPTLVRGASETVPQILTTYVVTSADGSLVYNVASATGTSVFGPVGPVRDDNGVVVTNPTAPKIKVDPLNLDFGTVTLGTGKTLTFNVSNIGDAPLLVSDMTLAPDSAGFSFTKPAIPLTIQPGDSILVPVTFTPSVEPTALAAISIASNDPSMPVATASLLGVGQRPPLKNYAAAANGGKISAFSHQYDATGGSAAKAIDGKKAYNVYGTGWWVKGPLATGESITVKLEPDRHISSVKIFNSGECGAKSARVLVSATGVTWTEVGQLTNMKVTSGKVTENVLTFPEITARYVRFDVVPNNASWLEIAEVEAWGW